LKILSLNIHFFPQSYGGATIVAERLSHGLIELGNEVYNIAITLRPVNDTDFDVVDTYFGTTFFLNHIEVSPRTRFSNPPASALIIELFNIVDPDIVLIHAPQHMGISELFGNKKFNERAIIIAHDFFWGCIQGFRTLPSGKNCTRNISPVSCSECSFFPGLTGQTYHELVEFVNRGRAFLAPSKFLASSYEEILSSTLKKECKVVGNPDAPEFLLSPERYQRSIRDDRAVNVGYFGGPGRAKGWDLVLKIANKYRKVLGRPIIYHLFDAGMALGEPWYQDLRAPENVAVQNSFHWSQSDQIFGGLDIVLAPSRVRESFGLAPREMLSKGGKSVIMPNGALAELGGYSGVFSFSEKEIVDSFGLALLPGQKGKKEYPSTSSVDYARRILSNV
jgi:glycosyltransferase involved in cell wall biosynthesis